MPLGNTAQGIYELADGKYFGAACCWDFGNAGTDNCNATRMKALFFGTGFWGRGGGNPPWFMADFEDSNAPTWSNNVEGQINLMDAVNEFATPGVELVVEPLARLRVITGFLLEAEINENGQDAVERRIVNQSIVPNPVDGLAYPGASPQGLQGFPAEQFGGWTGADSAFLDNGMFKARAQ
jgi:hypothetical protein